MKRFSNFIEHPVVMDVEEASPVALAPGEKGKKEIAEETLNARRTFSPRAVPNEVKNR